MQKRAGLRAGAWLLGHAVLVALTHGTAGADPREVERSESTPYPGIRHARVRFEGPSVNAHAVLVDLREPGLTVRTSRFGERWLTTRAFAESAGCSVAVNGGMWTLFGQSSAGVWASGGRLFRGTTDEEEHGFFALTRRSRGWISRPADVVTTSPDRVWEALSGRPALLERGALAPELETYAFARNRHPRTAVGVSRNGALLTIAIVDGRQPSSRGMNVRELARFLRSFGAVDALNLDGGGSTQLWVGAEGGSINTPPRGERVVLNNLCIIQSRGPTPPPAAPAPIAAATARPRAGSPAPSEPTSPRPSRLRYFREQVPALAGAAAAIGLLMMLAVRLARRRRDPRQRQPGRTERHGGGFTPPK